MELREPVPTSRPLRVCTVYRNAATQMLHTHKHTRTHKDTHILGAKLHAGLTVWTDFEGGVFGVLQIHFQTCCRNLISASIDWRWHHKRLWNIWRANRKNWITPFSYRIDISYQSLLVAGKVIPSQWYFLLKTRHLCWELSVGCKNSSKHHD